MKIYNTETYLDDPDYIQDQSNNIDYSEYSLLQVKSNEDYQKELKEMILIDSEYLNNNDNDNHLDLGEVRNDNGNIISFPKVERDVSKLPLTKDDAKAFRDLFRVEHNAKGEFKCYKLDSSPFIKFINTLGFWLYDTKIDITKNRDKSKEFVFIRIVNNIAYHIGKYTIMNYFNEIINQYEKRFNQYHQAAWTECCKDVFGNAIALPSLLPSYKGQIGFDKTKPAVFAAFSDCIIKVEDGKFEKIPYDKFEFPIWIDSILTNYEGERIPMADFNLDDTEFVFNSDAGKFLKDVSQTGRDTDEAKSWSFRVFKSVLGYLCTPYKDTILHKAVICQDLELGSNGERNGRTGKGLFTFFCRFFNNVIVNDKCDFAKSNFALDEVENETELFIIPECDKNFDIEDWYEKITGDWTIEKKGKGKKRIPHKQAPKLLFCMNKVVVTNNSSTDERVVILEFGKKYTKEKQPNHKDHFGRRLFENDWNLIEWQKMYGVILHSIRHTQVYGLLEPELINAKKRGLSQSTSDSFLEFSKDIVLGKEYIKDDLRKEYVEYSGKEISQEDFGRWLREFAKSNNYELTEPRPNINGKRLQCVKFLKNELTDNKPF